MGFPFYLCFLRRVCNDWRVLEVAAALITTPLVGLPAWGAACLVTPATQPSGGFINFNVAGGGMSTSCSVDGVTFSQMTISGTTTGTVVR
jgi:hypothetical protein